MANPTNEVPAEPPVDEPKNAPAAAPVAPPVAPASYVLSERDRKNRRTLIAGLGAIAILFVVFAAGVVAGTAVGSHHDDRGYNHIVPGNGHGNGHWGGGQDQYGNGTGNNNQGGYNGGNTGSANNSGSGNFKHPGTQTGSDGSSRSFGSPGTQPTATATPNK